MRPSCSTAASTSACAPAPVDTSLVSAMASPPAATISAATVGGRLGVGADALHRATEVVDHDAGAAVGEQLGVGAADAASGAGDDRDAPVEAVLPQAVTGASSPRIPPRVPPTRAARSSSGRSPSCLASSSLLPRKVPSACG